MSRAQGRIEAVQERTVAMLSAMIGRVHGQRLEVVEKATLPFHGTPQSREYLLTVNLNFHTSPHNLRMHRYMQTQKSPRFPMGLASLALLVNPQAL